MSTYLITGGAGFIGSHLAEALLARGARVRVVDDLSTGRLENLAHLPAVDLIEADLAAPGVAASAVRGVDVVLHQAAIPSVPKTIDDPAGTNRANLDATVALLVAARDAGVRGMAFAGSSAVFGDAPGVPKHEEMPVAPASPYAVQKLASEHYCRLFHRLYGLPVVVTRYFNVFGPRQDPSSPYSGVIARFASALLAGETPTIFGDGGQTRDFTYVSDIVDGVLRAVDTPAAAGEVVHIATGRQTSLVELLERMAHAVGRPATAHHAPARSGEVRDSVADVAKAQRLLGFTSAVSLDDGLRRTLDWYRAQAEQTREG